MDKNEKSVFLPRLLFGIYACFMIYFLFFASFRDPIADGQYHYNLEPFHEIRRFIVYAEYFDWNQLAANLAGNVVAFMPFGFLLPGMRRRGCGFFRALLACFGITLMIETLQLITGRGCFDVDDLLLNTIGGISGYLCYCICRGRPSPGTLLIGGISGRRSSGGREASPAVSLKKEIGWIDLENEKESQEKSQENEQKTETENCKKAN